jgi:dihydrofolate synthase/folylpolyglutamate synthase
MGMKYGLDRIRGLVDAMGRPQASFRTIHVVGTNGKGSTTALLADAMRRLGLRVGRFTSPHLLDYRERVTVDGRWIPREAVMDFLRLYSAEIESLSATFFEVTAAMAAWWFAQQGVEWAVAEAGLGGRLDATRTFGGEATLFTGVRLEHSRILGDTVELIAAEKAAIAEPGTLLIAPEQPPGVEEVLRQAVRERGLRRVLPVRSPVTPYPDSELSANADLAYSAARELLSLPEPEIRGAFEQACSRLYWPGRLDLRPGEVDILFDVAHNPQSISALMRRVDGLGPPLPAVLGFLRDKMYGEMAEQVRGRLEPVVATTPADPERALKAEELSRELSRRGIENRPVPDIAEAVASARSAALRSGRGPLVVTGSFFVVGEAMLTCFRRGWTELPGLEGELTEA